MDEAREFLGKVEGLSERHAAAMERQAVALERIARALALLALGTEGSSRGFASLWDQVQREAYEGVKS